MKGLYITLREFDALRGVSHLAVRLYLVLRRWMDIATGIVGQQRAISYQMLNEECEVAIAKGAGWQRIQATRKELRVALASLERAGLLRRLNDDAPVFLLPKAETASARPNQTGPEQGQDAPAAKPCRLVVCAHTGPTQPAEPGTHQRSEVNPLSTVAAAISTPRPVDKSPGEFAADFLDRLSKRLGYPILYRVNDPLLACWVEAGLCFEDLAAAVQGAIEARQRDGNRAPLNPGYIDAFLTTEGAPPDWWESWSGIVSKGQAWGIHQAAGETAPDFKARVFALAAQREEQRA